VIHALRQTSFPNVIGVVDGCHIAILAPWEKRSVMPKLDRNIFYNRKQVPWTISIVPSFYKFL